MERMYLFMLIHTTAVCVGGCGGVRACVIVYSTNIIYKV